MFPFGTTHNSKALRVRCGALAAVAFLSLTATATASLSFEERVACRAKVEDVYWAHRIWPRENHTPKPSRETVVPDSVIAHRIEESLRYETVLEAVWERPLSPKAIQAEIDRQARSTRDPGLLRELWAALGNDPRLIAECLVRPELAERRLQELSANQESFAGVRPPAPPAFRAAYRLPAVTGSPCTLDAWTATDTVGAPTGRLGHTAVWNGTEMIVWGGYSDASQSTVNSGGRYTPATDTWVPTSLSNAPAPRVWHTAVWTGTEMIVWGQSFSVDESGGRYAPGTDTWVPMSLDNAPSPRIQHTAVWTGSEMIVWGGSGQPGNSGGRYRPETDTWVATSLGNAPEPRLAHTAVWTGSEMIVWGGATEQGTLNSGGRYTPGTDTWVATSTVNAPPARDELTSVWTGSEMIVWGGSPNNGHLTTNTGGRYSPATDTWAATSTANAPIARYWPTSVWTGSEMIVWGGHGAGANLNNGGRYTPGTDGWVATGLTNAPEGRIYLTAVWTGNQMIVWGGADYTNTLITLNSGGLYCAIDSPVADLTVAKTHTGSLTQGQTGATYTITVSNQGSSPTSGTVSLADTLPTGLAATDLSGTGWTCNLGTLTCDRSDPLAAGQSYPAITLTVDVAGDAPAGVANTATVSGGGELNTANDTAADGTSIVVLPTSLFITPPCRLIDTRGSAGPLGAPALQPGAQRTFVLTGTCGIPPTAKALSLNVTIAHPTAAGDLRIFPGGLAAPLTSVINFSAGQTRANNAIATLGSGSLTVQLDSFGTAELIIDMSGYFE